jgi:thioredoxin-dependent peroxiredoxin
VVLRGWPGYQCPLCSRQVKELTDVAERFQKAGAQVVLVYPGPAAGLKEHAREFAAGKTLPKGFLLLLDPDYQFTNAYGLRWDAARETAYPSTFVLDSGRTIRFALVSRSHGGRAKTGDVLQALEGIRP